MRRRIYLAPQKPDRLVTWPHGRMFLATTEDGLTYLPPPELGDRLASHPLATYLHPHSHMPYSHMPSAQSA
ncbi:MAG TPA: hypothetical protein VFO20_14745 [Propionibacteriaceae bacterium]|nr:hypothetical protein [Propionibacteriaceae bacterium]